MKQASNDSLKRLENNEYARNLARERLIKAINAKDDKEIYTATGELLLWVLTTDEWHCKHNGAYCNRKQKDPNGKLLSGLKHAYNMVKHNMKFIEIHYQKPGGMSFPFSFPLSFPPPTVRWMTAGQVLVGKHKNQKENYEMQIEGKEILETFDDAISYLDQESSEIKKIVIEQVDNLSSIE